MGYTNKGVPLIAPHTVYPNKYAHGFVVLCSVVVMRSFIMNSHEVFIHIHQGCFAGTGAIVRLPQCQWNKPDGYGKISQCITTTKHSKAKTVCIFLGIHCIWCFRWFWHSTDCLSSPMKEKRWLSFLSRNMHAPWRPCNTEAKSESNANDLLLNCLKEMRGCIFLRCCQIHEKYSSNIRLSGIHNLLPLEGNTTHVYMNAFFVDRIKT